MGRMLAIVLGLWGQCALAADETATFEVYVLGLKAGRITFSARDDGMQYAVTGRMASAGVVDAFTDVKIDAEVAGRLRGRTPRPERYKERLRIGKDEDTKSLTYSGDIPRFETTEDRRKHWLDAAQQSGTVDPMTAVWELLRRRAEAELCTLDTVFFDGARKGRLSTRPASGTGDERVCDGSYDRIGGFSKRELKQGTTFPFKLVYAPSGAAWVLKRMEIQSTRGRAVIVRR